MSSNFSNDQALKTENVFMLEPGTVLDTVFGDSWKIVESLGEGGQGTVYKVRSKGREKALKWYKPFLPQVADGTLFERIKGHVLNGAPSQEFLWPTDVTNYYDGTFGYIMELKPDGYYDLTDFTLKKVSFRSFQTAVDAALNIVSCFRILHNKGYSYQDLNDGNFFIDPENGSVLICDNDNVVPDGDTSGVWGKPRYMAPEIVLRKRFPNVYSDRFSMSVILFILLTLNHPLEGRRSIGVVMSPDAQEELYGTNACFMMDEQDDSNRPVPKVHDNTIMVWNYLPDYMRKMFLRAFSKKALGFSNMRPIEADWIKVLTRFRNSIVSCGCGNEVFIRDGERNVVCDKCGQQINIPAWMDLMDYSMPAIGGSKIYKCQVTITNVDEALQPVGKIIATRDDYNVVGFKNFSGGSLSTILGDGSQVVLEDRQIIRLVKGMTIQYGNTNISIR